VQIVEATTFGVRSVVFTLEAQVDQPRFVLFPMIHIAEQGFYDDIGHRLDRCDLILYEGAPSLTARILSLSYSLSAGTNRLGLVSQKRALPMARYGDHGIRTDITAEMFRREWRRLPLPLRAFLYLACPIVGLHRRFFSSREQIARRLGVDLLPSRDHILIHEFSEPFMDLILSTRDRILVDHLAERSSWNGGTVGVVYGAMHMRAVIRFLTAKLGYRITLREFVTVMTLQD
jgi:hypothetical protein